MDHGIAEILQQFYLFGALPFGDWYHISGSGVGGILLSAMVMVSRTLS